MKIDNAKWQVTLYDYPITESVVFMQVWRGLHGGDSAEVVICLPDGETLTFRRGLHITLDGDPIWSDPHQLMG